MHRPSRYKFVIQWAIATTMAGAIAPLHPMLLILWPLLLGTSQWLVLRRYLSTAWTWIIATVIGTALAVCILFCSFLILWIHLSPLRLGDGDFPQHANSVVTALIVATTTILVSLSLSGAQYTTIKHSGIQCNSPSANHWLLTGTAATAAGLGMLVAGLSLETRLSPEISGALTHLPNGFGIAISISSSLIYGGLQGKALFQWLFR